MTAVIYVLSLSLGAVATALALVVTPHLFTAERYRKTNYRGRMVFAPGGIVLGKPVAVATLIAVLTGRAGRVVYTMAGAALLMGLLGWLDDVYGDRQAGGLLGHARALLRGQFTTGMLKAVGGVVVGLVGAYALGWRAIWIVVAGAVIALCANLVNLLDLRPGRATKVWAVAAGGLLVAGVWGGGALVLATVVAGLAVFTVAELREDVMLGDTGANLLGTVLGVAFAASLGRTGLLVVLAVLAVATVTSEAVSFTRVIEATPPLRWLDELGRPGGAKRSRKKRVSGAE